MAIFGLVIFVLSFYVSRLYLDERHEINHAFSELLIEVEKVPAELTLVGRKFDSIENIIEKLEERKLYDSIKKLLPYHDYQVKKLKELFKESDESRIEGEKLLAKLDYNDKKKELYHIYSDVLILVGGFLMVYGFFLWYYKHQRYIDAERKWTGETFIELLKDDKAKKKAIQDELNKKIDESENESDSTSSET